VDRRRTLSLANIEMGMTDRRMPVEFDTLRCVPITFIAHKCHSLVNIEMKMTDLHTPVEFALRCMPITFVRHPYPLANVKGVPDWYPVEFKTLRTPDPDIRANMEFDLAKSTWICRWTTFHRWRGCEVQLMHNPWWRVTKTQWWVAKDMNATRLAGQLTVEFNTLRVLLVPGVMMFVSSEMRVTDQPAVEFQTLRTLVPTMLRWLLPLVQMVIAMSMA
jgi:hypothetical protein